MLVESHLAALAYRCGQNTMEIRVTCSATCVDVHNFSVLIIFGAGSAPAWVAQVGCLGWLAES